MENLQQLRSRLSGCFPPIRLPATAIYGGSPERIENDLMIQELISLLADKTWQEVDAKAARVIVDDLCLTSREAFIAYLPAFLLAGKQMLEAGDERIARSTAFELLPEKSFVLDRVKLFNPDQSRLIAEWLVAIGKHSLSKFLADHKDRALRSYWGRYLDSHQLES